MLTNQVKESTISKENGSKGEKMSANDKQVGGNHYNKDGEQHWDRQWRLYGRGYFVGCITKYVERYHLKNGVQDLEKAKHFLEKLIELEINQQAKNLFINTSKPVDMTGVQSMPENFKVTIKEGPVKIDYQNPYRFAQD